MNIPRYPNDESDIIAQSWRGYLQMLTALWDDIFPYVYLVLWPQTFKYLWNFGGMWQRHATCGATSESSVARSLVLCEPREHTSVAVLAEISLRLSRELFILIIKKIIFRIKLNYPKNKLFNFENSSLEHTLLLCIYSTTLAHECNSMNV